MDIWLNGSHQTNEQSIVIINHLIHLGCAIGQQKRNIHALPQAGVLLGVTRSHLSWSRCSDPIPKKGFPPLFGPNCDSSSQFRVLLSNLKDWVVISFSQVLFQPVISPLIISAALGTLQGPSSVQKNSAWSVFGWGFLMRLWNWSQSCTAYEPDVMAPQGHPLVRRYIDVLLKIGNRQLLHIPLREHAEASTGIIASLLSVDVDNPLRGP